MSCKQNFDLTNFNTFKIKLTSRVFCTFASEEDVKNYLSSTKLSDNYFIVGGGSNLLFLDDFYNGVILKSEIKDLSIVSETDDNIIIKAGSGIIWDDFVKYCTEKHYCGLENLSYIPGTVGASAVQNIGAYGVEAKDYIFQVDAINIKTQEKISLTNEQCKFDYRYSIFKTPEFDRKYFITFVYFKLDKKFTPKLNYSNLKDIFADSKNITPGQVRNKIISIRKEKLPEPEQIGNAGSFFKNPVINKDRFNKLQTEFADVPYYKLPNEMYKIPAAWLIEKAGWKAKQINNVSTYHKQALVIINTTSKATGKEIEKYAKKIIESVKKKFNIELSPEVIYVDG